MKWKNIVADYFTFSKKDRIALLVFVCIILFVYLLAFVLPRTPPALHVDPVLAHMLDSATKQQQPTAALPREDVNGYRYEVSKNTGAEPELFAFDPNTLDAAGWKRLGLRERTIKTLLNYRNKGGHFYKPEDVKKIWGLSAGFYERVSAYITIETANKESITNSNFFKTPYEKKNRTIAIVDVNAADTSAFIALPGIGSKLAQRIVAFRIKLGGFYSVDQISETYGLPDSSFQNLKPFLQVHGDLKKFNLNTATKDELKTHPYIKWNLANAIVEYRAQHGHFKKLDEVKNIVLIDKATFEKLSPYLTL